MNKMNPITTFDSSYEFIELHRTFHELSENSNEKDDLDLSWAFSIALCVNVSETPTP
jgi:hypothetical protein